VKPLTIPLQFSPPAFIEPDEDYNDDYRDDCSSKRPSSPPLHMQTPRGHASISRQALYHVINLAFNAPPPYTISRALLESPNHFRHIIDIEEVCNGVVHPITKETITKYPKLMNDPLLKKLWVPAMSKELHCLAQGKKALPAVLTLSFFSRMTKSSASPKTVSSPTRE